MGRSKGDWLREWKHLFETTNAIHCHLNMRKTTHGGRTHCGAYAPPVPFVVIWQPSKEGNTPSDFLSAAIGVLCGCEEGKMNMETVA
jgi:hypothetical protein